MSSEIKFCFHCGAPAQPDSKFCTECGRSLTSDSPADSTRISGTSPVANRKGLRAAGTTLITIIIVFIGLQNILEETPQSVLKRQPRISNASGIQGMVEPVIFQPRLENGKVLVPLPMLTQYKMLFFTLGKEGSLDAEKTPMIIYLSPSGRVMTLVSYCVECKNTQFFLDGPKLRNRSGDAWDAETLSGLECASCMKYPPSIIPSKIDGDLIVMEESRIVNWVPKM